MKVITSPITGVWIIIVAVLAISTQEDTNLKEGLNYQTVYQDPAFDEIKNDPPESKDRGNNIDRAAYSRSIAESRYGADLLKRFWNTFYADRPFNSSFAFETFYTDVVNQGRDLKQRGSLSSINGNLALLGMVVLGGIALASPMIFPEVKRNMERSVKAEERQTLQNFVTNGLVGISESIMGWVERSVDDLPSLPRLDAQECMKRCVCEAHNQPKKYGLTGLILQLFFPPYIETDEPSRVVSKYQLAARYGRQDNANCASQYDGCMVNFLDLIQGLMNLLF